MVFAPPTSCPAPGTWLLFFAPPLAAALTPGSARHALARARDLARDPAGPGNVASLVLRVGLGAMFVVHGGPKLLGGPDVWEAVGRAMAGLGVPFAPTFWGLLAALSEFGGGLLLALGVLTRPAALFLTLTMLVATSKLLLRHNDFAEWSHPAEAAIAFATALILGPGRYSLGAALRAARRERAAPVRKTEHTIAP